MDIEKSIAIHDENPASDRSPKLEGVDEYAVPDDTTFKTWIVITMLSFSIGVSFWPVPTTSVMQSVIAAQFGKSTATQWFLPSFTTGCALGFLLSGTNSDLFGRRIVILTGNALSCVGFILCGSSHSASQFTAGMAILGFASGMSQLGLIAVPELLPNKYRHVGIVLSDGILFPILITAPIIGRYAVKSTASRDWHGVPWKQAIQGLDYVGALLVTGGVLLTLMGIVYTTYLPSNSPFVLGPLISGIGLLVMFGVWENVSNVPYKLCPPHIFSHNYGRAFSAPFILGAVVTMFYYGINIIWPTMIAVFYTTPTSPISVSLILTLPANLGLVAGAFLFATTGHKIGHWKTTLIVSFTGAVLFGGLLGLCTPHNKSLMIAITFLEQLFFGWAQYEAVAFVQLGVDQLDLGASGGLAGVARFGGGSLAVAVYTSVLTNSQSKKAADIVVKAGIDNGLTRAAAQQLLAALSLGSAAISAVPGVTPAAIAAAGAAFLDSYAYGLKMTALASLGFGGLGIVMCCLCEDIGPKMNNKVNVFLENDVNAEKNKFH
ncbi:hypothetical protein BP5796_01526 [Coleophoma crateriformis]|uniref:Major facilitator superfamily (MFS) profile domain-containing protein n=1 Tax=Coleophoma crateriformis TaxID=565419 RepID=A0A3D8T0N3_9HELO|nr:hypothetical protein BP5796_01526 [Coleophoma crateriformis]